MTLRELNETHIASFRADTLRYYSSLANCPSVDRNDPASVPDTNMRNAVTQFAEQEKGFYGTRALRQ